MNTHRRRHGDIGGGETQTDAASRSQTTIKGIAGEPVIGQKDRAGRSADIQHVRGHSAQFAAGEAQRPVGQDREHRAGTIKARVLKVDGGIGGGQPGPGGKGKGRPRHRPDFAAVVRDQRTAVGQVVRAAIK